MQNKHGKKHATFVDGLNAHNEVSLARTVV